MAKFTFMVSSEGKLPPAIASTLTSRLKEMSGKKATIELAEAKDKRSLDQNAFLWGVIYPTIRQFHLDQGASYSIEQIHESCLHDFAELEKIRLLDGYSKLVPMRSKNMNVEQMNQYIRNIEMKLNEFSVYFPVNGLTSS